MIPKSFFLWTGLATLVVTACTGTLVLPGGSTGTAGNIGVAGDPPYTTSYPGYSGGPVTFSSPTTSYPTTSTYSTSNPGCEAWVDYPGTASQTIRFVNQTGQPLYLPVHCDGRVAFSLTTPNGSSNDTYAYDTYCLQTCQELETQHRATCATCSPSIVRLDPGQTLDFPWDGTALEGTLMEPYCFLDPGDGACFQKQSAPAGVYTASASAYPDFNGAGTPFEAATAFPFPSNGGPVEVVFTPGSTPDGG